MTMKCKWCDLPISLDRTSALWLDETDDIPSLCTKHKDRHEPAAVSEPTTQETHEQETMHKNQDWMLLRSAEPEPVHAPLPWHYQEESDAYTHIIRGPSNQHIVQFPQDSKGRSEALARFIVTACNSYEALQLEIQRLRDLLKKLSEKFDGDGFRKDLSHDLPAVLEQVDAALPGTSEAPKTDNDKQSHAELVLRFDLEQGDLMAGGGGAWMKPCAYGDYIQWDSHEAEIARLKDALEAAEQILKRSPLISTNDNGNFRGITTRSVLEEVRDALANAAKLGGAK